MELVTIGEIEAAVTAIAGTAVRTPLLPSPWADADRLLWLKPENLQPVGSFKIRGARNAIRPGVPGVVTHSSGNHGLAVSYVASRLGIPVIIVAPDTTPEVKLAAMRDSGATVLTVPPEERLIRAEGVAAARGYPIIPPFDHRDVIAGQGTIGHEIATDLPGVRVVLVPVSGGGLASGVGTAIRALAPQATILGVEPELAADAAESLRAGRIVAWPVADVQRTIADGLRNPSLSDLTFAHLRTVLDGIITVTEEEIRAAMGVLARRSRLVAEPSGAVATAAYLYHREEMPTGDTVAIVSGGNVDPALLKSVV
ncbi:threonine ammonia-lyase [Longispora albida]|uniref:threonine ammonia-lyase n=1 Tax=Longispora albida TaxID=203523 RepID=UPI0004768DBA|nr:threonine/serine dehydratase [Longispora albida]